ILTLNKKTTLAFILIFTTVVVFDSSIDTFSSYSGVEFPTSLNVVIFITFYVVFVISSIILINSDKIMSRAFLRFKYFQAIIISTLILSGAFILVIILEMLVVNRYSISLLIAQTYLSHFSALVFLSLLAFLFARWFTSKRSYIVMLYTLAFSLASVNLVISFLYLQSYLSISALPDIPVMPIASYVTNLGALPFPESLSPAFDVLSLSSFLFIWIATALILSQYRYKMGRIKYFSLMIIPLIYYIFPFQNYFGDVFFTLLQSYPVFISLIYILIFSATRQVGALLFSLAFWTASSLVYDERIRKSLLIASIGIAILFGSLDRSPLQFHAYPPYGLVTEAFIPLGTYLLIVGIFTSAIHISRDSELRKEFYKSASSQVSLLKSIGVSQMEKELEGKYKKMERKVSELPGIKEEFIPDYSEENVKEILHDVLNELYYSKSKKKTIGITDE
ncbi:MAG: hypothetical protein WBZ36_27270, partial [Candidatus Nitrosopolaris sp.]